ncbi:nucleotidyltransferase family protein [Gluconacetobacter sacchari]|uniref:nucleotidyltransferase family protein n=1 Tax=Gluconacetobacter sacchari TaxID=92759 RepID=UPI0039B4A92A
MTFQQNGLRALISQSPLLNPVLEHWTQIALPHAWLVAGAIAQTVWNHAFGLPPDHGIDDIDIVYFDENLGEDAEAAHAARIERLFAGLPVRVDVKNQARVHVWYEEKFGYPIMPYRSVEQAITTFPTTATAVGVRPGNGAFALCAPFGLSDLLAPVVRANKRQITRELYEKKTARWRGHWPDLTVIPWDQQAGSGKSAGRAQPSARPVS